MMPCLAKAVVRFCSAMWPAMGERADCLTVPLMQEWPRAAAMQMMLESAAEPVSDTDCGRFRVTVSSLFPH